MPMNVPRSENNIPLLSGPGTLESLMNSANLSSPESDTGSNILMDSRFLFNRSTIETSIWMEGSKGAPANPKILIL